MDCISLDIQLFFFLAKAKWVHLRKKVSIYLLLDSGPGHLTVNALSLTKKWGEKREK